MEIVIIILGFIIDRLTKLWAVKELSTGKEIVIIKDFFSFSYLENRGAAFGMFQNKQFVLIILTSIVALAVIYYLIRFKPKNIFMRISLALIISGALGNIFDRVRFRYVVDFIYVHYQSHSFPTMNVADMMVTVGTFLMAFFLLKEDLNGNK
ncbi:MAG TPA: signal peptidase II [Clostridiaceae bacterium]